MTHGDVQNLNGHSPMLYRVAEHSGDYRAAHAFLKEQDEHGELEALAFPTILAIAEGQIVGLLGTIPHKDMIIAGPLVVRKDKPRSITALRLIELYDNAMRQMGISTYTFFVPKDDLRFKSFLERAGGFEWIGANFDGELYARRLT